MDIVNEQAREDHLQHAQNFEKRVQQHMFPVNQSIARIP